MNAADAPSVRPGTRERTWQVDLAIVERDGQTTAHAFLVGDGPLLNGDGRARIQAVGDDAFLVADEVAVARALRQLADRLLRAAGTDIGLLEDRDAVVVSPR